MINFKGRYFPKDMILMAVRWKIVYPLSYRNTAYQLLEVFERWVKQKLMHSIILHVDETGINVNGKLKWLHVAANGQWTHFYPHVIFAVHEVTFLLVEKMAYRQQKHFKCYLKEKHQNLC